MGGRTGFSDGRELAVRRPPPRGLVRDYLETVLVCLVFFVFIRAFILQQSEIPSSSMEPTLLIGDYVLVNRFQYGPTVFDWERRLLPLGEIRRGDVVVFAFPAEPEQDFIKRVVGLPGETVALRDGALEVDGRRVEEPYLAPAERHGQNTVPVRVPAGSYFVLGDHRSRSSDSREWGSVAQQLIKGRAFLVLLSTNATADPHRPPGRVSPLSLARKIYDVAFHSRWDRCLTPIR